MGMSLGAEMQQGTHKDLPVHDALDLTRGGDLAIIRLADQHYTLRVTRAGKLILTK